MVGYDDDDDDDDDEDVDDNANNNNDFHIDEKKKERKSCIREDAHRRGKKHITKVLCASSTKNLQTINDAEERRNGTETRDGAA